MCSVVVQQIVIPVERTGALGGKVNTGYKESKDQIKKRGGGLCREGRRGRKTYELHLRPKEINALFLISSPICHRVGRLAAVSFFSLLFFQVKLRPVNRNFFF